MNKMTLKRITAILLCSLLLITALSSCGLMKEKSTESEPIKDSVPVNDDTSKASSDVNVTVDRLCAYAAVNAVDNSDKELRSFVTYADRVAADMETLTNTYTKYLLNELEADFEFKAVDYDEDGVKEAILLVNGFDADYAEDLDADAEGFTLTPGSFAGEDGLIIYFDNENESSSVIQVCCSKNTVFTDDSSVVYAPERLDITYSNNAETLHVFISQDAMTLEKLAGSYSALLDDIGYGSITSAKADIADVEGEELIFNYYDEDGYRTVFISFNDSKIVEFHSIDDSDNSVFISMASVASSVIEYSQSNSGDLFYTAYRFDENLRMITSEDIKIRGGEGDISGFTDSLNNYLSKALVCIDRYQISGEQYDLSDGTVSLKLALSVQITNASNTRTAYIDPKTGSFVYLRSGPGKSFDPICSDPYNEDTFLRLLKDQPVEVIGVVNNTSDKDNPVWLEVELEMGGRLYTGYTSMTYMKVSDFKHISAGSTFDLITTADSSDLYWSSSDDSIASVDKYGIVTARSKGAVYISVVGPNDTVDSCLIVVQ